MNELFKASLQEGRPVIGPFVKSKDPAFVEVAGAAGFDFVILDQEHGAHSYSELADLIRAAEITNTASIVRIPSLSPEAVSKPLDLGATGIQLPNVKDHHDVEYLIKLCNFPKKGGYRGSCKFVRAAEYSKMPSGMYFNTTGPAIIVQVEGEEGFNNLDAILDVEGYDVLFIGPYDLSASMGLPGQVSHSDVVARIADIVVSAREKGKCVGIFVDTLNDADRWIKAGCTYLSYSVDVGLYMEKCLDIISQLCPDKMVTELMTR